MNDSTSFDSNHHPARSHAERRERLRTVSDRELVLALRTDDALAWSEFADRARRALRLTASRLRFDPDVQQACGEDLLARIAAHLIDPAAPIPDHLSAYIAHAALRCRREHIRNQTRLVAIRRRAVHEDRTLDLPDAVDVVASLLSDYTKRASRGEHEGDSRETTDDVATALARQLLHELREVDGQILTWHTASVPHRTIGEWLGLSPATVAKRVQRLLHKARARLTSLIALLSPPEQDAWRQQWRLDRHSTYTAPPDQGQRPRARRPSQDPPTPRDDAKTSD